MNERARDIEACALLERIIELKNERHQLLDLLAAVAAENFTLRGMLAWEFLERVHADGRLDQYHRRDQRRGRAA